MTAYGDTDIVTIDNLPLLSGAVAITGSVNVTGITLSSSFPSSLTVDQGAGDQSNPWFVSASITNFSASYGAQASRTYVSASMSDVTLISANPFRVNLIIYNDSDASLFLGLGPVPVSTDDFTLVIEAQDSLPFTFTGEVHGIWESPSGVARMTELT